MAENYSIKEEAADEIVSQLKTKETDLTSLATEITVLKYDVSTETNTLLETTLNGLTTKQFLGVLDVFCKKDGIKSGSKVWKSRAELKELGGPMLSLIHQEIIKRFGGIQLLGTVDAVVGQKSKDAMIKLQGKLDYKNAATNIKHKEPDGIL